MRRSINTSFALAILITLVVVAGYIAFFVVIKNTNEEVSALSHEVEIYGARETMLRNTDKLAEDLQQDIANLSTYFLTKDGVVGFIETIEKAGVSSGVEASIGSVAVVPAGSASDSVSAHGILTMRVDAVGTWSEVLTFLEYIQHMPYKLRIDRAAFSKVSSVTPFFGIKDTASEKLTPQWNASFEIKVETVQ